MSGECDECGEHTLECTCRSRRVGFSSEGKYTLEVTCGTGCPCRFKEFYNHWNLVRNPIMEKGIDPPAELPPVKYINVRGRVEHEAVIKDAKLCEELGLDQMYETMVYLKRWGGWLSND